LIYGREFDSLEEQEAINVSIVIKWIRSYTGRIERNNIDFQNTAW